MSLLFLIIHLHFVVCLRALSFKGGNLLILLNDSEIVTVNILILLWYGFLNSVALVLVFNLFVIEFLGLALSNTSLQFCILKLRLHIIVLIIELLNRFGMILSALSHLFLELFHVFLQLNHWAGGVHIFWLRRWLRSIASRCSALFSTFKANLHKCSFVSAVI